MKLRQSRNKILVKIVDLNQNKLIRAIRIISSYHLSVSSNSISSTHYTLHSTRVVMTTLLISHSSSDTLPSEKVPLSSTSLCALWFHKNSTVPIKSLSSPSACHCFDCNKVQCWRDEYTCHVGYTSGAGQR